MGKSKMPVTIVCSIPFLVCYCHKYGVIHNFFSDISCTLSMFGQGLDKEKMGMFK